MSEPIDFEGDAIRSYAAACDRRQAIIDEWKKLGRPLVTEGSRKQVRPHPLLPMIAEADQLCDRLRKPVAGSASRAGVVPGADGADGRSS